MQRKKRIIKEIIWVEYITSSTSHKEVMKIIEEEPETKERKDIDSDGESYDKDEVAKSLAKVGKGAIILVIGTIIVDFFGVIKRVLIARIYTPSDYGMYSLYITIIGIFGTLGALGFKNGIQRNISYFSGKDEKEKVPSVIGWGLAIGEIGGVIFGILLFIFATPIASLFSDDPVLGYYFKLAAISIPFTVLTLNLVSVFRGVKRTKERVLFYRVGRSILSFTLMIIVFFFSLNFQYVILATLLAGVFITIVFFLYYLKKGKKIIGIKKHFGWDLSVGKKLILFSLPLMLVGIMNRVMGWADNIMIGYFLAEDFVGYYQAAKPLTTVIKQAISFILFIYSPIAASLYAQEKIHENKALFTALTKWLCFGTFPITLTFIFFPRWIINFLFGSEYLAAVIPLQILAIVYFINNFMGPNGATLTAYGKTKFLMYATGAAAGFNIVLNWVLIPIYGIAGAATATGLSLTSINILRVKKLKNISGIHPFKSEIIEPIVFSVLFSVFLVLLLRYLLPLSLIIIAISAVSFYVIFLFSMILTKSLSKDDIKLLLLVEKKIGIDLTWIKNFLKKFI